MNRVQFLQAQVAERLPVEELEVENLIATYLVAKAQMEEYVEIGANAKARLQEIINVTGITRWETDSGVLVVPADSVVVRYDAAALDAVRQTSKTVNRYILPHRSETFRAGGIRITGYA